MQDRPAISSVDTGTAAPASSSPESLAVLLGLTTGVQVLTTFVVATLPTLAPKVAASLGVEPHLIGYQVSIVYGLAAILSVYSGLVVQRLGACLTSILSVTGGLAALAAMSTGSIAGIVVASVVLGIGYGLPGPAASHLFMRFAPLGRRNLIFSIKQAGMPLGVALASFMMPALSEKLGWQAALLVSTGLLAVLIVTLLTKRSRWDDDRKPAWPGRTSALAGIGMVMANPVLRAIGGVGLCYGGYQMCVIAFTVTMLVKELDWSLVQAGLVTGAMQIAGVTGRIGFSVVADSRRAGLSILAGLGIATGLLGMAVAWIGPGAHHVVLVGLLLLLSCCMLGWNGIMLAETARISGRENVGVATGGILALCFFSVVLMPPMYSLIYQYLGSFSGTLGLFSVMPLIGAMSALSGWRYERR